jgi:ribose transport system substrate-binding protein
MSVCRHRSLLLVAITFSLAAVVSWTGCSGPAESGGSPSAPAASRSDSNTTVDAPAVADVAPTTDAKPDSPKPKKRPQIGFVTNGIASFWVIAEAGARAAAKEFDVDVEVKMPPSDGRIANQKRMIEELLTMSVSGIAVSPIKPEDQNDILNAIGEQCHFITHDADAPDSNRLAYVGMNNYDAGRVCGQLVKEALPDGGEIIIFVGSLDQLNARLRRQGLIDELLDRSHDPKRYDQPDVGVLKGTKYTVVDTRTDDFDFAKGKSQAEEAIAKYPDLDGMVGLFAYNPPLMLEALKGADKIGKIKVIAFDEDDATLQAILDGHCVGTVVQDPYRYGYESVRILAGLARDDKSVLPVDGFLEIKQRIIRKDNAQSFWDDLKKQIKEGESTSQPAS